MGLKLNAFADLGNFNDYSSGGSSYGSDYSGGGYSSGDSYGGGYYYYSDSDDSDITGSDIILTIIVIGIVLFISYIKTKNSKKFITFYYWRYTNYTKPHRRNSKRYYKD